ncbi:MAG: hypothetical protein GF317_04710 [Candidatus Lokiarchaeota archaeon]|nr:hypothetical protein [Candidatus Lokiarchaeota archaeon]
MKNILVLFLLLFIIGCGNNNDCSVCPEEPVLHDVEFIVTGTGSFAFMKLGYGDCKFGHSVSLLPYQEEHVVGDSTWVYLYAENCDSIGYIEVSVVVDGVLWQLHRSEDPYGEAEVFGKIK